MIYDIDYYYHLLKKTTEHAQRISEIRWKFVKECKACYVLDYGCGVSFFKAFAPSDVHVDTYDVGPFVTTGISRDKYDLICLWDVLEHIPYIDECLKNLFLKAKFVALAIPILPEGRELEGWKHFRPGEHLHYFDDKILDALFGKYSFRRIKAGYFECPPREDVEDILYKKNTEIKR